MSETSETPATPVEGQIADATGHEEDLVQTEFPPDEFPDPPQNDTDLGLKATVDVVTPEMEGLS